jgi:hypothetical protein
MWRRKRGRCAAAKQYCGCVALRELYARLPKIAMDRSDLND